MAKFFSIFIQKIGNGAITFLNKKCPRCQIWKIYDNYDNPSKKTSHICLGSNFYGNKAQILIICYKKFY